MSSKEIESWKGFEYPLKEENGVFFNEMFSECILCSVNKIFTIHFLKTFSIVISGVYFMKKV